MLTGSTGANPDGAAKSVDLEAKEPTWAEELCEELPIIQESVQLSIPHYNFLYERWLRL